MHYTELDDWTIDLMPWPDRKISRAFAWAPATGIPIP